MNVATQEEVAADFAGYVKAAKKGPIVVTSKGKPVAVLLGSESEEDVERLLMGHSPKLQSILEAARERAAGTPDLQRPSEQAALEEGELEGIALLGEGRPLEVPGVPVAPLLLE